MNAKGVAKLLQNELISNGFTVHRYNAYSTDSIYLKVDGGLCKSIRISDHTGKGHLRYTYNLLSTVTEFYSEEDKGVTRYYYPYSDWHRVLKSVMSVRDDLQSRYSESWYNKEVKRLISGSKTGFWSGAYLVKKGK